MAAGFQRIKALVLMILVCGVIFVDKLQIFLPFLIGYTLLPPTGLER